MRAVHVFHEGEKYEVLVQPGINEFESTEAMLRAEAAKARCYSAIIVDHLRSLNLLSWTGHELPRPGSHHAVLNDYPFAAYGFSYLNPLVTKKDRASAPTPAPVVIDLVSGTAFVQHVESFVDRIQRAGRSSVATKRILGVIVAEDFHIDAWNTARKLRLMAINLRQLTGEAALDALKQISELLTIDDESKPLAECVDHIGVMLSELTTNPFVVDIRSHALESVAALSLLSTGYENVQTGRTVPYKATSRELDVYGDTHGKTKHRLIECKACLGNKEPDESEVIKFFKETVPAVMDYYKIKPEGCIAEVWTTGVVSSELRKVVDEIPVKKDVTVAIYGREEVKANLPPTLTACHKLLDSISKASS